MNFSPMSGGNGQDGQLPVHSMHPRQFLFRKHARASLLKILLFVFSAPLVQAHELPEPGYENVAFAPISGRVTNNKAEPLEGVSITIKGTEKATTTDAEGRFTIDAPANSVLVFSYVGFATREVNVGSQSIIAVELEVQGQAMNEVVVTALGIERKKSTLSYSAQSVNTKTMTEAREVNIMNSLQGKVAGLNINASGAGVGSEARVVLRGNRSISGDSQPLYVVDGIPVRGYPANLSQDNIASIDVLKGPNAAALYGSAAQNGAIVIETKKGRAGRVQIGVNSTAMFQKPILAIELQNEYGQGLGGIYNKAAEASWGPKLDGQMVETWSLDPADAGTQYAFKANPDNQKDIFRTGFTWVNNVNVSVGGEKTQSFFSYTNNKSEGILPNNDLMRHNVSLRVTSKLAKGLTLDTKLEYINQHIDNRTDEGESNFNPYRQIYRMPSNISTEMARKFEFVNTDGRVLQNYWNPSTTNGMNPYWTLYRNMNNYRRERVMGMASLSYAITDKLKVMLRSAYDGANTGSEIKLYNDTYTRAPLGRYTTTKGNDYIVNSDFLLSYSEKNKGDFTYSISAGGNMRKQRSSSLSSNTGVSMIIPNFFAISNTNLPVTSYDPGLSVNVNSLYAFANLGWRDMLFLDITGRNDWSSTLPADNRSYFYPSVGFSALLTEMIKGLPDAISYAKFRGSWAQVGNGAQPYMLSRTAAFSAGGNNGFLTLGSTLPNPNLKPERTESIEMGLDLRFFSDRLGLDFTLYKTNTRDQLFTIALPVGSGASQYYTNGGDIENKGLEIMLSGTPIKNGRFTWDSYVNFSTYKSMVNSISDERPRVVVGSDAYVREFVVEQGHPFGEIYSRGFQRDEDGNVLVGANGIPLITSGRTKQIANFNPDFTAGWSNNFSYKNFSLSFLIDHRQGGSLVSMTKAIIYGDGFAKETLIGREGGLVFGQDIFKNEKAVLADGSKNNIPVAAETFWNTIGGRNTPVGEAFVSSATNTRLRELSLGYSLPKSVWGKLPISNIRLALVGRNLLFLYRADNTIDPDFLQGTGPDSEGFQSFAPPTPRSFGLNLKVDF
jgi:TonB-linked SusC/RagA family outer membrane protein